MTMRYVHPTPQHKKEALKKLENFQTVSAADGFAYARELGKELVLESGA